jgi:hypothetical protein
MPRGPRLDVPGALHHVMVRGIERRDIFNTDEDREDLWESATGGGGSAGGAGLGRGARLWLADFRCGAGIGSVPGEHIAAAGARERST